MPDDPTTTDDTPDEQGDTPDVDFKAEAEKWKALARKHEQQAKNNADKAKRFDELEDSQKSEIEKATSKATEAEQRASAAEARAQRLEVALAKAPEGMPVSQIRKLAKRLQGDTPDDLEADAEELFADFAPPADDDAGSSGPSRRPQERLTPGASNDAEPEKSPEELADAVIKRSRGY